MIFTSGNDVPYLLSTVQHSIICDMKYYHQHIWNMKLLPHPLQLYVKHLPPRHGLYIWVVFAPRAESIHDASSAVAKLLSYLSVAMLLTSCFNPRARILAKQKKGKSIGLLEEDSQPYLQGGSLTMLLFVTNNVYITDY